MAANLDEGTDSVGEEPFSYRASRDSKVMLSYRGRRVVILTGREADSFPDRIEIAGPRQAQLIMAKATGKFRHGNERLGRHQRRPEWPPVTIPSRVNCITRKGSTNQVIKMSTELQITTKQRMIIAGLALVLVSPALLAQPVYRWTDAAGQVHFSHTPPVDQEAEQVNVRSASGSGGSTPEGVRAIADANRLRDEARAEQVEPQAQAAEEAAYRRQVCAAARSRLAQWRSNPRTRFPQEDGSNRRYLPEEMDANIAEDEQKVRDNC